ncbi:MAG: oxidoreductase, partial [Vampirovibrionia bacterium]
INKNIIISDVQPGFVDTDMAKGDKMFWVASPQKAAKQIFSAIKNKKKFVYITRRWLIAGLLLRFLHFLHIKI